GRPEGWLGNDGKHGAGGGSDRGQSDTPLSRLCHTVRRYHEIPKIAKPMQRKEKDPRSPLSKTWHPSCEAVLRENYFATADYASHERLNRGRRASLRASGSGDLAPGAAGPWNRLRTLRPSEHAHPGGSGVGCKLRLRHEPFLRGSRDRNRRTCAFGGS